MAVLPRYPRRRGLATRALPRQTALEDRPPFRKGRPQVGRRTKMIKTFKFSPVAAAAIGASILAPALMGVGHAYAEETSVEDRVLITTAIKADDTIISFGTNTPAFTSTRVKCEFNHCTMRVEVSSQFANIRSPDIVGALVTVDNSEDGVLPSAALSLDTANRHPTGAFTVRTFSWMIEGLDEGHHTVDVYFFNNNRTSNAGNRTLTIEMYN
jgi:hypothetical protein